MRSIAKSKLKHLWMLCALFACVFALSQLAVADDGGGGKGGGGGNGIGNGGNGGGGGGGFRAATFVRY